MNASRHRLASASAAFLALIATPALAQRTAENAVTGADDAFGTNIGSETTGIYNENDARGFSPTKAGNARLDGIYFDPVVPLTSRLKANTTIRVGFATQDYPFPAPTGIADTRLRTAGDQQGFSLALTKAYYDGGFIEYDARVPIVEGHLSLVTGFAGSLNYNADMSSSFAWNATLKPVIRAGGVTISPFYAIGRATEVFPRTLVLVNGDFVPEVPTKGRYLGQKWAKGRNHNNNGGVTLLAPLADGLSLRAGLFHSQLPRERNYSDIFAVIAPSGLSTHRFISDPQHDTWSLSGEAQVAYAFGSGDWRHRVIAGVRGRDRHIDTGGSDVRNFGQVVLGQPDPEIKPSFVYGPINQAKIRQTALMLGYLGRIDGVGRINLGIQKANYRADALVGATGATSQTRDAPWLYNASLAVDLSDALTVYGGTSRGLEDSGTAPDSAINRAEQLPATRTTQYEGGVRWKFPAGQLAVSAFQISKPYFSFDGANRYVALGNERHRGVEASLNARIADRLSLLAGAVLMEPKVSGAGVAAGLIGDRAAGTPSLYARLDANYRTDLLGGLTPTLTVTYVGRRAAGSRPFASLGGEQLMLPARTTIDLGLRQQFKVGPYPASFRAVLANVLDSRDWRVLAPNTLQVDDWRRFTLGAAIDF